MSVKKQLTNIMEVLKSANFIYDYSIHDDEFGLRLFCESHKKEQLIEIMETCGCFETTSLSLRAKNRMSHEGSYNVCVFFVFVNGIDFDGLFELMLEQMLEWNYGTIENNRTTHKR